MVRFVVGPDGAVVPDLSAPPAGPRRVGQPCSRAAVEAAVKRRAFARAFKREVTVDPALAELVDRLLETAALEGLSLANKGGAVVAGFTKVADAIAAGGGRGADPRPRGGRRRRRASSTAPCAARCPVTAIPTVKRQSCGCSPWSN